MWQQVDLEWGNKSNRKLVCLILFSNYSIRSWTVTVDEIISKFKYFTWWNIICENFNLYVDDHFSNKQAVSMQSVTDESILTFSWQTSYFGNWQESATMLFLLLTETFGLHHKGRYQSMIDNGYHKRPIQRKPYKPWNSRPWKCLASIKRFTPCEKICQTTINKDLTKWQSHTRPLLLWVRRLC